MKKLRTINIIALILCILVLFFTITDFLALHDIWHDYISRPALEYVGIFNNNLPLWTSTMGEWRIVSTSLYFRLTVSIFLIVTLIYSIRKFKVKTNS